MLRVFPAPRYFVPDYKTPFFPHLTLDCISRTVSLHLDSISVLSHDIPRSYSFYRVCLRLMAIITIPLHLSLSFSLCVSVSSFLFRYLHFPSFFLLTFLHAYSTSKPQFLPSSIFSFHPHYPAFHPSRLNLSETNPLSLPFHWRGWSSQSSQSSCTFHQPQINEVLPTLITTTCIYHW